MSAETSVTVWTAWCDSVCLLRVFTSVTIDYSATVLTGVTVVTSVTGVTSVTVCVW